MHETAYVTGSGLHRNMRMTFSPKSAETTFTRGVEVVLVSLKW